MADVILDYSEFLEDSVDHYLITDQPPRPLQLSPKGQCPFCRCPLKVVHEEGDKEAVPTMEFGYFSPATQTWYAKAWLCNCGWWETESIQKHTADVLFSTRFEVTQATLRRFAVDSVAAPVRALQDHVSKNENALNYLHPTKMEKLVQSVFQDFFRCEVEHCGRSHDGGIDLILVDSDSPVAVQVKRRGAQSKAEAVSVVREFLGACLLEGYQRGMLVTTAKDFSKPAKQAARRAITNDLVDSFELVNGREFFRRLQLVAKRDAPEYWRDSVDKTKRITSDL